MPRRKKYINYEAELEQRWYLKFLELKKFKRVFRHCNVPQQWKPNQSLASWVAWQKYMQRRKIIDPAREELLNKIGFVWRENEPINTHPWEFRFQELLTFKEVYGHCNVPLEWKENKQLGSWVSSQRNFKQHDKLSKERVRKLDAVGFQWKLVEKIVVSWEQRFEELIQFKAMNGHCLVPHRFPKYKHLAIWVRVQRSNKMRMAKERIDKLDSIGFTWNVNTSELGKVLVWERVDEMWNHYLEELRKFRQRFGHCDVPQHWKENNSLGNWVVKQRSGKKKMKQERIDKLDELGFAWSLGKGKKKHLKNVNR